MWDHTTPLYFWNSRTKQSYFNCVAKLLYLITVKAKQGYEQMEKKASDIHPSLYSRNIYVKKSPFKNILLNYYIKLLANNIILSMQTLKTDIEWINYFSPKVTISRRK